MADEDQKQDGEDTTATAAGDSTADTAADTSAGTDKDADDADAETDA